MSRNDDVRSCIVSGLASLMSDLSTRIRTFFPTNGAKYDSAIVSDIENAKISYEIVRPLFSDGFKTTKSKLGPFFAEVGGFKFVIVPVTNIWSGPSEMDEQPANNRATSTTRIRLIALPNVNGEP